MTKNDDFDDFDVNCQQCHLQLREIIFCQSGHCVSMAALAVDLYYASRLDPHHRLKAWSSSIVPCLEQVVIYSNHHQARRVSLILKMPHVAHG